MAIRILFGSGAFIVEGSKHRGMVDVKSESERPLRDFFGPTAPIKKAGRLAMVQINRESLADFVKLLFDRYGA